jgi:PAS domain S-box-containing protein
MVISDDLGRIVLVNRAVETMLGWSRAELIGQSIDVLVPDRHRTRHGGHREGFVRSPETRPMGAGGELRARRKDGTEIEVEIALNPIRTEAGLLVLSSIVDIGARKDAERTLRESEERFRLLLDGIRDYAVVMLGPDGSVASWNASAERMTGYRADEILGRPAEILYPEDDRATERPASSLRAAATADRHEDEGWRVRKDGSRFLAHAVLAALRDERGQVRGYAEVLRDVTEPRRLEEQQRRSQKLEAIGTLASGIAHDFNNILGAIVGCAELVKDELDGHAAGHEDVDQILRAAERGRQLVARILTFSRGSEQVRVPTNLAQPLGEAIALIRASLPSTLEIRERFELETPPVLADATQIHQVVMNLATNAAHAMGSTAGRLEVTLAPFRAGPEFASVHPNCRPGVYARLTVMDTGVGMPADVLQRAFDPFFTTKAQGVGTGLGLSVVHGIVTGHAGAIEIASEPGKGTTVDVYLPGIEVAAPETAVARATKRFGSGQSILVVDDEKILATVTKRLLERSGFRVTSFTSSEEALAAFEKTPGAFDLIVSDNTMPRVTGVVLAQRITTIRPGLPVILVTGLGEVLTPDELHAAGIRRVLLKPVTGATLGEAVAEILEGA